MNIYEKCTAKPYSFLVIDISLTSDNPLRFRKSKFKISAPTWNKEFELTDGSYSISDIPDYFEEIFKNI